MLKAEIKLVNELIRGFKKIDEFKRDICLLDLKFTVLIRFFWSVQLNIFFSRFITET